MADIQANIGVNIETGAALAQLKQLQREISAFHTQMAKGGAAAQAATANMQQNLINSINATGKFNAGLTTIKTTTESFTNALEKNKFSMGQYFKYGMASTKTFSRFFTTEFDTINKVARERVKDLQTQYIKMGRDANGAMQAIAVRPLALDMNDLGTKTAIAAQKQQLFNQLLKQGSTNLLNFGKNTQWAGRQLMVGFTIPLTILGTTASRVFMEMEKQAIAFRKVYGDLFTPEGERRKALQDVQALGEEFTKYGIAIADTIGLAADAAAAGFAGADLQAQTAQATKLAILGQIETQKALETTIALQSSFKMSNEELAESIDFLNAVENQTVVSLDDITTAIPKVAPVIMSLGGNVKDLAFFMAAMKEGGINASEGANALKSSLAAIINPTEKSAQFMQSLGINIRGIVEQNAGDLMGTMLSLATALDQLDPLNRARAIEQLFGKFQFARISTLFDNIIRQGSQAQRVSELAGASIQELAQLSEGELAVVSESTTAKFEGAFERLKAQLAPVGEEFLKLATPFVEFGTRVLEAFNNMGDGTKRVIMGLITILGGIGPIAIMAFGLLMNGVANVIKTFAFLRNIFTGTQQDTRILGQQFEYMTQEQIQAASVAASLNQIHSSLIQTFTSEAGSVDKLRMAYERAIAVQRGFRGPIISGSKTVPPQKMASGGIVRGPGTGRSDSVPIMASNGEAVIPAASVARNPEAVNMLISGNLPRFVAGGIVGSSQASSSAIVASHFDIMAPGNLGQTIADLGNALDDVKVSMFELAESADGTQIVIDKFEGSLSELADANKNIMAGGSAFAGTTRAGTGSRNAMFNALGVSGEAFDIESLIAQSQLAEKAKAENSKAYQKHTAEIEKLIIEGQEARTLLAKSNDQQKVKYEYMRQNTEAAIKESMLQKRGITAQEASIQTEKMLSDLDKQYATLKASGISEEKALSEARRQLIKTMLASGTGQFGQAAASFGTDPLRAFMTGKGRASGDPRQIARTFEGQKNPVAGRSTRQIVRDTGIQYQSAGEEIIRIANQEVLAGTKRAAKSSSPSRVMKQEGKNLVDGLVQGVREGKGRVSAEGADIASGSGMRVVGGFEKLNRGIMTASFALTSLSSIAMFAGGQTGKFAEFVTKVSAAMFALTGVVELLTLAMRTNAAQSLLGNLGGGRFALGGRFAGGARAAQAAGLGPMKQFGAGLSNLIRGPIPSLISKFAKLGGVLGAVISAGIFVAKEYQKQKDAIEGLGNVANMSAEKIQKFGDIFGVAVTTGGLERGFAPSLQDVSAETQAGGQQLIQTEQFQTDFAQEIEAIRKGATENVELALQSLAARLEASGFAQDQVQAIINALVEEAGRKDVVLNFGSLGISTAEARTGLQESLAQARQNISQLPASQPVPEGGGRRFAVQTSVDQERLQALDQYASSLVATFDALGQGVEKGLISVDDFNMSMDTIIADFDTLSQPDKQAVFDKIFESLPAGSEKFKELLGDVDSFDAKIALIRAKSSGMVDDDAIQAYAKEIKNAEKNGKSILPIINRLNGALQEQVEITAEQNAQEILNADIQAGEEDLNKRLESAQQQIDVYNALIAQGVPVAQAQKMIGDATVTAALAAALGTAKFGELIDQYNAIAEVEGQLAKITSSGGGGGGGRASSSIDKLTESLRNLVSANATVGEGFDASSRSIDNVLRSSTGAFDGLSQQLRRIGASEDLINLIVGMPPEEFNKYKNRLFNFDPATRSIIGLKGQAKQLGNALRSIAIGEYLEEQRAFVANTKNQITAITRLRNAGLSYADALKVVQNQSVATAIATAATAAELREILRITQEVSRMQEQMDRESERSQVSESVRASNKEFANQAAVLSKLAKAQGQYTDAQISAILDDPDLSTLFLDPSIDPGALRAALKQAEQRANLELNVKIATEAGRLEVFDEYIGEVNDYFSREQNKIEIDFALATQADQGIINEAQNRIAAIQFEIDDYQAQLRGIEEQESEINKKYADRASALDEVAKANERINRAQQAQLNIADALSRGDIAAAARAQQELRNQQAQATRETSRETLQRQQAAEIANIRSQSGLSREQIDEKIRALQNEIFGIEESQLEPAEERIRIAEYNKQLQIDALAVSGKTQQQWEQISNLTSRAAQDTEAFATNIERALALYEYFVNGVELSRDLFGEIEAELNNIGIQLTEAPRPQVTPTQQGGRNDGVSGTSVPSFQTPAAIEALSSLGVRPLGTSQNPALSSLGVSATPSVARRPTTTTSTLVSALASLGVRPTAAITSRSMLPVSGSKLPPSRTRAMGGLIKMAMGGKVKKYAGGGMIIPKRMAAGGYAMGSDIVPAMLTPGEFVVRRPAVKGFGVDNLEKINNGTYNGGSVYNYNLAVNVKSSSDPDRIARTVIAQIKQVENQRIRGNRV